MTSTSSLAVALLVLAGCSLPAGPAPTEHATGAAAAPDVAEPGAADTPRTNAEVTDAQGRDGATAQVTPVVLNGVTSGDNVYLQLTPATAGAAPQTVLCTAPECAGWMGRRLPGALKGRRVGATFGHADQVDGSGAVIARGVRAVVALRLPAGEEEAAASAATAVLPLMPGVFVLEGTECRNPANAAVRVWTGRGLSGSATRDCRATVLSHDGGVYRVSNSCVNSYDGSRTAETLVIGVPDRVHFTVAGNRFGACPMAQVPAALRRLVR